MTRAPLPPRKRLAVGLAWARAEALRATLRAHRSLAALLNDLPASPASLATRQRFGPWGAVNRTRVPQLGARE